MTNTNITNAILHCPICDNLGSVVRSVKTTDWRLHCRKCNARWFHPQQASISDVASALYEYEQNLKEEENNVLCKVRAQLRSAPRRQFECAPNIYSSWLCQDSVLDILDAAILKSEQNLNRVMK